MPFGFVSPKVPLSVCAPDPPTELPGSLYGAGGAGAGKLVIPGSQLVGSNAPVVNGDEFGNTCPSISLNVSVTGPVAADPPASAIRMNFLPAGLTSRTSRSSGNWFAKSNSVTRI